MNDPNPAIHELDAKLADIEIRLSARQALKADLDDLVARQRDLEPNYYGAVAAIQNIEQRIAEVEKLAGKNKDPRSPHNHHAELYRAQQAYDEIRPALEALEHQIIQIRAKLAGLSGLDAEYAAILRQKAALIESHNHPPEPEPPPAVETPSRHEKRQAILAKQDWIAIQLLMLETEQRTLQIVAKAIHSPHILERLRAIQSEIDALLNTAE